MRFCLGWLCYVFYSVIESVERKKTGEIQKKQVRNFKMTVQREFRSIVYKVEESNDLFNNNSICIYSRWCDAVWLVSWFIS